MAETPVLEQRLSNGLYVLMQEAHDAPIVCVSVWYRVGSRHDPLGQAGLAHMLEHMTYKGTVGHARGEYDRILHECGAITNASTTFDRTNYYLLIGSDRYPIALQLESDRMRGALLAQTDLRDEQTVVDNEIQRSEDDPPSALFERLQSLAFRQHPYGRPVLGWHETVVSLTEADLRVFYDQYYQPGNAFVVVTGDFRPAELSAHLGETFGGIPPAPAPRVHPASESPQRGERRFELRRAGSQELLIIAYKIPARDHPASYALDVLAQTLGHGRTARLYRRLIEPGLAVDVGAENQALSVDPFLFIIDIDLAREADAERVIGVVDEEIARLTEKPLEEVELARARKRARADFIMRRDRVSARAFLLGECEAALSWRFAQTYLDRLDEVTAEQAREAARRYLVRDERTIGHFRPVTGAQASPAG